MLETPVCALLGIKHPVFQGGMAWVSEAFLAAAVSKAGGLGIISAMNASAEYLEGEIDKCRAIIGDIPFAVNIMLQSPFADDVARVVAEKRVPIVTTGAGMPGKYMEKWLETGIKVIPVVASVAVAKRVERMGANAVIAEGGESGGHVGELTTMALVPQVADAVSVPVIAAGGIADGRGIAAAFMLGAQGVQCGTRFLTAKECRVHENYKQMILKAKDIDTLVTGKRLGHPVRALKNGFTRKFLENELNMDMTDEQVAQFGAGAVRKAAIDGDTREGSFLAGQIAGMITDEPTCLEIIESMVSGAERLLSEGAKWVR